LRIAIAPISVGSTRDRKVIHSPSEVLAAHARLATQYGDQASAVVADARARAQAEPIERVRNPEQKAHEAVSYAKDRGFEREAVSDERSLMRDALRRGMGDLTYSQVRRTFEQRLAGGEFQTVEPIKRPKAQWSSSPPWAAALDTHAAKRPRT